jgi:hypothetical protein
MKLRSPVELEFAADAPVNSTGDATDFGLLQQTLLETWGLGTQSIRFAPTVASAPVLNQLRSVTRIIV